MKDSIAYGFIAAGMFVAIIVTVNAAYILIKNQPERIKVETSILQK